MIKFKTIAAALAALTLATTFTVIGGEAQAKPKFGAGIGFAAGALIGAAAVSANSYYVTPGYDECRFVNRVDRWGNVYTVKICDVAPD
jgi:hypothetical protein